ncbi:glyoxylate/hydroxypyruvate reductase A [Phenylobacterium sp.]|uniref:2-hydroxyacid dehydrogenase n=1 Tax=Phenylobacterium sp. TaxID=1871053 RepID=UPI00301C99EF
MNTQGQAVLLLACFGVDAEPWARAFATLAPDVDLRGADAPGPPDEIDYVLAWNVPAGGLRAYARLKAVFSLGAGVDGLVGRPDLGETPVVRMVDESLAQGMVEYVLMSVLRHHRDAALYARQQARKLWIPHRPPLAQDRVVGVLGLGELGGPCASALAGIGFQVRGWARTPRSLPGVEVFWGAAGLSRLLQGCEILVCLLPLTPDTAGLLDADLFARLPRGACVINVGRGAHLVEADLLAALDSGQVAGATLDVFDREPLAADHPFWTHPSVVVTPHASAFTHPESAAAKVVADIRRIEASRTPTHLVDRSRGY